MQQVILSSSRELTINLEPLTQKVFLELGPPNMQNNQGDADRIRETLYKTMEDLTPVDIPLQVLQYLPYTCRRGAWKVTATLYCQENFCRIINIEPGDTRESHWGLAADIGSTTIVAYLIDMNTGKIADTASGYNEQAEFGEDILTRIQLAGENDKLLLLQEAVVNSLNLLIRRLVEKNNLQQDQISALSIAGNTTMIHLFLGITPSNLCKTPYVPALNDPGMIEARDVNVDINKCGIIYCIPSIGSYVGGDVVADILVSELYKHEEVSVLVDIGTNGEIVLGNKDWLVACAGAAGPALEGGVAEAGMRAEEGAIIKVGLEAETKQVFFQTIGNKKPKGLCGSGLIDCISELFLNGIIDRKGEFKEGYTSFTVVPAEETAHDQDIVITRNDINNFIRTKGAVNTALEVLLESVGLSLDDISYFYAAGAFGNYINPESAVTIGLFPDLPLNKIIRLGNSAAEGARVALLSREKREDVYDIASKITYFELNANKAFMDKFTSGLFLPHTDLDVYPTVKEKLIKRNLANPEG